MNEVEAFAAYLAGITDQDERARAMARAKLLALNDAPKEAFKAPIRTAREYLDADIEIPPVLIHPFIAVRGGLNCSVGRAGKGKTVMNLNRMIRWSAGLPMFDGWTDKDGAHVLAPDAPLKVLIVENEGAAGMFHRQFGQMITNEEYLSKEARELALDNCLIWGEGGYSHLKLDNDEKLNELRGGVEEWKPDMVFIEPFRSLWNGEENSSTEMNVVVDALVGIATDFDCGVWISHHEKKGGHGEDDKMSAARGSSVLEGIVTVMENFESASGGDQRELSWSKSRYEVPPIPIRMKWNNDAKWYNYLPPAEMEAAILRVLQENPDEAVGTTQLSEELDEPKSKLTPVLKEMCKDGKLKKMPSAQSADGGTTGYRYRLPTSDPDGGAGGGGLSIG